MNTYTQKITAKEAIDVKRLISEYNPVFDVIQYSVWRAKTASFQATYYTSGKLLIQGKNIDELADRINKLLGITVQNSPFDISISKDSDVYIGTDESGKGDFFGPLVIAGVQVSKKNRQLFIDLGIKDSKKLDDKKILQMSISIKAHAVHSVIVINPQKYNELYSKFNNLNKLLAWGHARAIENILEKSYCNYAIADKFGDENLIKNALMTKGKEIVLNQMVRAEADIAVAAASVLARAEFVKRMDDMQSKYELSFSKGASDKVIEQAKIFVDKYSYNRLSEVAKMHFKTVNDIKQSNKI